MNISLKLKEKESVLRFKNGSPKLKDVLRKKCKERLQKNRNDFIDKLRNLDGDLEIKNELTNMIKEDLKTICTTASNNTHSQLEDEEIVDEELEWLMNQYNMIFDNEERLMEMFESLNEVICPICEKNILKENMKGLESIITCVHCQFSIKSNCDLLQIKEKLMACLDGHNNNCNANPQFNLLNEEEECHMYLMCYHCSSFEMVL